ncbi:MAG: hypothetical protein ACFBSC_12265 [Microcoleaceae cyanobacterium]
MQYLRFAFLGLLLSATLTPFPAQARTIVQFPEDSTTPEPSQVPNPVQPSQSVPVAPNAQPQLTEAELRAACSAKRYDLLPIPYSDVSPSHWAFEAVMNLYYCIGLPPEFDQ